MLLLVEVSDTSLGYDRDVKLPRYATAGVKEVWIADLEADVLLVYREPFDGAFSVSLKLGRGESVSVAAFPDVVFEVDDLLG